MKKFLALILVAVLAFSMTLTAFAAPAEVTGEFKFTKVWTDENGNELAEGQYPDYEIKFDVEAISAEKYSHAAYADPAAIPVVSIVKAAGSSEFVLSGTEAIEGVGIFTYLISEHDENIAGVTPDTSAYTLKFLVSYVEDPQNPGTYTTEREVSQFDIRNNEGEKVDTITNIYTTSDVTLDKVVTGNLSNGEDEFELEVYLAVPRKILTDVTLPDGTVVSFTDLGNEYYESDRYTITIKANDGLKTITGIPEGVSVFVEELDPAPYELVGYTVNGVSASDVGFAAEASDTAVVITNDYSTNIDTGISLDSLPYILVIAAVAGGLGYFFIKKRQSAFDAE